MKDTITSRLQLFLAKIAGRDVSESTLTPPVITNMEEKLLDEIANRMDAVEEAASSGGGGDNIVLDLNSLKKPTIDGEEIYELFIYANEMNFNLFNAVHPDDIFVCDFNDDVPLVKQWLGDDLSRYRALISQFGTESVEAAVEQSVDGEPHVCLLNDVHVMILNDTGEKSHLFFPSDAQFGIRNISVNTNTNPNPNPSGDA